MKENAEKNTENAENQQFRKKELYKRIKLRIHRLLFTLQMHAILLYNI